MVLMEESTSNLGPKVTEPLRAGEQWRVKENSPTPEGWAGTVPGHEEKKRIERKLKILVPGGMMVTTGNPQEPCIINI